MTKALQNGGSPDSGQRKADRWYSDRGTSGVCLPKLLSLCAWMLGRGREQRAVEDAAGSSRVATAAHSFAAGRPVYCRVVGSRKGPWLVEVDFESIQVELVL